MLTAEPRNVLRRPFLSLEAGRRLSHHPECSFVPCFQLSLSLSVSLSREDTSWLLGTGGRRSQGSCHSHPCLAFGRSHLLGLWRVRCPVGAPDDACAFPGLPPRRQCGRFVSRLLGWSRLSSGVIASPGLCPCGLTPGFVHSLSFSWFGAGVWTDVTARSSMRHRKTSAPVLNTFCFLSHVDLQHLNFVF